MEIAPFRGLHYSTRGLCSRRSLDAVTAPPYDVISAEEHRKLLDASPYNISRITLGSSPGACPSYEDRASLLDEWIREGILGFDEKPSMYVYSIAYTVPGTTSGGQKAQFRGLIALGKLHPFDDGVVLPHEQTFPKVVDDRFRLLDATKTNLESIFLLYADRAGAMDRILEVHSLGEPTLRVEAKPGEFHSLYRIDSPGVLTTLQRLLGPQRTIIADGHHRYTTSLKYMKGLEEAGRAIPGCGWQLMTFANLYGEGLSILATHRLVKLKGEDAAERVLDSLVAKLEVSTEEAADLCLETRSRKVPVRFPRAMRTARTGAGATSYGLLQDIVLGDWLTDRLDGEKGILYFKEGTGETAALLRKEGDILFRMKPVDRREFETVVQRGEVFPHKTTYFYPKLWSGLVMWRLDRVE